MVEKNIGSAVWYEAKTGLDVVVITVISILAGFLTIYLLDKVLSTVWLILLFFPTFIFVFAICFSGAYWIFFTVTIRRKGGEDVKTFIKSSKIPITIMTLSVVFGTIITKWLATGHPDKLTALLYVTFPISLFTLTIFIEMIIEGGLNWKEKRKQKIRPE